jgi:hypothetical protein
MSDISPYSQPKPPKTITQVKDDRFLDFTCLHTWILLAAIGSALYLFNQIARGTGILQLGYVALLIAIVAIWIKYFATFEKVDQQKLRVKFFYAGIQGKHIINKFAVPVSFLERLVPIVGIHQDGIIEFKGNKYGVLMETYPVRISEEEREGHEKRLEKLINGIPSNTHFKTIACSRLEPRKPILQYLLDVSCNSNGDKATDLHLAGLYSKIAEDNSPVISWKYYAFLSLGEWKTQDEARIQYGAIVPGLLKNMKAARLQPRIYQDENEISNAYRTMFSELII